MRSVVSLSSFEYANCLNLNCLNRPQELLITSYIVWVYSSLVFMSQLHEKLTDNFFFFPSGTALKRLVKSPNAQIRLILKCCYAEREQLLPPVFGRSYSAHEFPLLETELEPSSCPTAIPSAQSHRASTSYQGSALGAAARESHRPPMSLEVTA